MQTSQDAILRAKKLIEQSKEMIAEIRTRRAGT